MKNTFLFYSIVMLAPCLLQAADQQRSFEVNLKFKGDGVPSHRITVPVNELEGASVKGSTSNRLRKILHTEKPLGLIVKHDKSLGANQGDMTVEIKQKELISFKNLQNM